MSSKKHSSGKSTHKLGIKFRSNFEAEIHEAMLRNECLPEYEPVALPYVIEHNYFPDWVLPNGICIEAKGRLTTFDRAKMIAVKRAHPHIDIRFVFMNANNKLTKRSKTTYWQWAESKGFPWAEWRVPKDWIEE